MYPTTLDAPRVPQPLKYEITVQPAQEPVSYQQLAEWCKLPSFDDQALTMQLAVAGRRYIEGRTRQTLITTTYNLYLDYFPQTLIIPARPLQAVNSIEYVDQTGTTQTLATDRYLVDSKGPRPVVIPPLGTFFPIPHVQYPNCVTVNFTAGFGDDPSDVPQEYQTLICQWVITNYEIREAVVLGKTPAIVPHTFDALLRLSSLPEV
jgi:uncharacterized phiE125 gp8 family phage protein